MGSALRTWHVRHPTAQACSESTLHVMPACRGVRGIASSCPRRRRPTDGAGAPPTEQLVAWAWIRGWLSMARRLLLEAIGAARLQPPPGLGPGLVPAGRIRGPIRGDATRPRRGAEAHETRTSPVHRSAVRFGAGLESGIAVGAGGGRGQRRGSLIGGRSPDAPRALAASPAAISGDGLTPVLRETLEPGAKCAGLRNIYRRDCRAV